MFTPSPSDSCIFVPAAQAREKGDLERGGGSKKGAGEGGQAYEISLKIKIRG